MDRHKKNINSKIKGAIKTFNITVVYIFLVSFFVLYYYFYWGLWDLLICILGTPISKVEFRLGVPKIQKKYHYTVQKFREILDPEHPLAKTITLDKWKCPYHFIKLDPQPPFFVMYIITYHLFIHKSRLCSEYQDMYKYTTY